MVSLLQLPPELVHHILSYVRPEDLGNIIRTCRFLKLSLEGNRAVYRSIYLRTLDEPPSNKRLDWEREIHDLLLLQRICSSKVTNKKSYLPFVLETVVRLLGNANRSEGYGWNQAFEDYRKTPCLPVPAETEGSQHYVPLAEHNYPPPSYNVNFLSTVFSSKEAQEALLTGSFIFERARGGTKCFQSPPDPIHQQSAKLHSLYGMALSMHNHLSSGETSIPQTGLRIANRVYPFACSKVYDLREYAAGSGWGPFLNDGSWRVDWEKVEAILLVVETNLRRKGLDKFPIFWAIWGVPFAGSWAGSYWPWWSAICWGNDDWDNKKDEEEDGEKEKQEGVPLEGTGKEEVENVAAREDPYGVTGTWLRVVCFIDYNDFYNYNFVVRDPIPDNVPRPILNVGEATRLITMKISVTKIEDPGEDDHPDYPVVYFKGKSRSLDFAELWDDSADSDIRGTVRTTPEGEVRWTSYSIFDGEERWKSEGIQIGGMKSGRGVVGNWFEKDHDPRGPCGPTAFWKISNKIPAKNGDEEEDDKLFEFLVTDFRNTPLSGWMSTVPNLANSSDDEDFESDSASEGYEGDEEREEEYDSDIIERDPEVGDTESEEEEDEYASEVEIQGDEYGTILSNGLLLQVVEGDFTADGLDSGR